MNHAFPPETPESGPVPREPYLNIPPATGIMVLVLCAVFGVTTYVPGLLDEATELLAFIPAWFFNDPLQHAHRLASHGLLHYGWTHILLNITGLLAFGSGVERIMGSRHMTAVMIGGIILGALGHSILYHAETVPLGGASGGVSALFGASIPFITPANQWRRVSTVFILFNIAIGMLGVPSEPGLNIAWQAHIAGFLFGLLYGRHILKTTHPVPVTAQDDADVNRE